MKDNKSKYFVHRYTDWNETESGEYYQDYLGIAATFENLEEAIEYAKAEFHKKGGVFKVKDDDCYYDNGLNKTFYSTTEEYANYY